MLSVMNLDDIKKILELVREHALTEFELERDGLKLRIRKEPGAAAPTVSLSGDNSPQPMSMLADGPAAVSLASALAAGGPAGAAETEEAAEELAVVKSPIVGTFYLAPEPDARPFVQVGDSVRKGQVLCIIEAMKLMNEIEAEYGGEIVKIYVENGQPVQYGERLFAIRVG